MQENSIYEVPYEQLADQSLKSETQAEWCVSFHYNNQDRTPSPPVRPD